MHRTKHRTPKQTERRAMSTIFKEAAIANSLETPDTVSISQRAMLVVKRGVADRLNPFVDPAIQEVINHPENQINARQTYTGAALLDKKDIKILLNRNSGSPVRVKNNIETATAQLPVEIDGRLGGVAIFGVKREEEGMRYVGMGFSGACSAVGLKQELRAERAQILGDLGISRMPGVHYMPHISLFATPDQQQADEIVDVLCATGIAGKPIVLACPDVTMIHPQKAA